MATEFTPLPALAGGLLIGVAAALLLHGNGRTAGVSGIVGGLVRPLRGDGAWRVAFVAGLVLAGAVGLLFRPALIAPSPRPFGVLALAGLLVGVGTRVGGGCTSGHGVCGIGRGSRRSLAATLVFVATGMLTVTLVRLWGGLR
ncbi:MAG TPA: YeeE/YedE family protein [Polyangiaceae bacterium]|nr:YeeE/YedE family protein [Polyangiaceae bacterium]